MNTSKKKKKRKNATRTIEIFILSRICVIKTVVHSWRYCSIKYEPTNDHFRQQVARSTNIPTFILVYLSISTFTMKILCSNKYRPTSFLKKNTFLSIIILVTAVHNSNSMNGNDQIWSTDSRKTIEKTIQWDTCFIENKETCWQL